MRNTGHEGRTFRSTASFGQQINNRRALAHQIYRILVDVPAAVDILVETPEKIERYRNSRGFVYAEAARGLVVYER
ncbi:MAG: hypothetical protein HPY89_07240 [Pelotomaculum sp.]|nr:hypothetical protein [Pelotomaculum sp.]